MFSFYEELGHHFRMGNVIAGVVEEVGADILPEACACPVIMTAGEQKISIEAIRGCFE